ncbi:MAG: hypothetical protein ACP5LG_05880 [Conexivisphaera sp.]
MWSQRGMLAATALLVVLISLAFLSHGGPPSSMLAYGQVSPTIVAYRANT